MKLVDKPDLGSGAERRMGSIPFARTQKLNLMVGLFSYGRRESAISRPLSLCDIPFQGNADLTCYRRLLAGKAHWAVSLSLSMVGRPRCFNFLRKSRWRGCRGADAPCDVHGGHFARPPCTLRCRRELCGVCRCAQEWDKMTPVHMIIQCLRGRRFRLPFSSWIFMGKYSGKKSEMAVIKRKQTYF